MPRLPHSAARATTLAASVTLALVGMSACGTGGATSGGTTTSDGTTDPSTTSSASSATSSSSSSESGGLASCSTQLAAGLTPEQQVGQLLMVALTPPEGAAGLDDQIAQYHVGNMLYLGGWQGSQNVAAVSEHLQSQMTEEATGGIGMIIAADQEGGAVQQLTGAGFSEIPSALAQATLTPENLEQAASVWGKEMSGAGVNLNLAPIADTVPEEIGEANGPIGQYGRQYGSDPETVGTYVAAFTRGMLDGGVTSTVKHFPGIGRITGNTDVTAEGITDTVTTADDPYLQPFVEGIEAGAGMVMMSSATYTQIDPENPAVFSPEVIDGLLRDELGYKGVVITDDVGAAAAVQSVPAGERATRFISAGGDIVLTVDPATTAAMHGAVLQKVENNEDFAAKVGQAVERVIALKIDMDLAACDD